MKTKIIMALVALFSFSSLSAWADHPAYLHALSDLRLARAYIESGDMGDRATAAVNEIDRAIWEIKQASIDDGKNLNDHPPVDTGLHSGRFHRALELVNTAHDDVRQEEDNGFANGLRGRAIHHIDAARDILRGIINN